jgi:hypothetical protein
MDAVNSFYQRYELTSSISFQLSKGHEMTVLESLFCLSPNGVHPCPEWAKLCMLSHSSTINTTTICLLSNPCHLCRLCSVALTLHFTSMKWCHFMGYKCPSFLLCPFSACRIHPSSLPLPKVVASFILVAFVFILLHLQWSAIYIC